MDPLTPLAEPDRELNVPMSTFLREVRLPEATRDIMMAWLSSAFGCEPNEVSALNALSLAAVHGHDARLMVGFGSDPEALDAKSVSEVQDAFAAFLPDARVLKVDAHDWNADHALGRRVATPEGRLAFATADTAIGWTGYIDGRPRAEAALPSVQSSYQMHEIAGAGRLVSTCRTSGDAYDPPDRA